jgi:hypothetical protein
MGRVCIQAAQFGVRVQNDRQAGLEHFLYATFIATAGGGGPTLKIYNGEPSLARAFRLQVMLSVDEMKALDDFRFEHRMPSRAATVRELMRVNFRQ